MKNFAKSFIMLSFMAITGCMSEQATQTSVPSLSASVSERNAWLTQHRAKSMPDRLVEFYDLHVMRVPSLLTQTCGPTADRSGAGQIRSLAASQRAHRAFLRTIPQMEACYANNAQRAFDRRMEIVARLAEVHPELDAWGQTLYDRSNDELVPIVGVAGLGMLENSLRVFQVDLDTEIEFLELALNSAANAEVNTMRSIGRLGLARQAEMASWSRAANVALSRSLQNGTFSMQNGVTGATGRTSQRTADLFVDLPATAQANLDQLDRILYGNRSAYEAQMASAAARGQLVLVSNPISVPTEVTSGGQASPQAVSTPAEDTSARTYTNCYGETFNNVEAMREAHQQRVAAARAAAQARGRDFNPGSIVCPA